MIHDNLQKGQQKSSNINFQVEISTNRIQRCYAPEILGPAGGWVIVIAVIIVCNRRTDRWTDRHKDKWTENHTGGDC